MNRHGNGGRGWSASAVAGALLLGLVCLMGVAWERCGDAVSSALAEFSAMALPAAASATPPAAALPSATPEKDASPSEDAAQSPFDDGDTSPVFRVEVVVASPAPQEPARRILIYHTHTWEAYQQVDGDRYVETEKWRSRDEGYNVVAVGRALTAELEAMGYEVVHDTTAFEPPTLSTAYERSLAMLEERTRRGETYDLYLDLHRDAIASNATIARTVNIGGEEVARFMVLVGKGTNASYDVLPDFNANHAVAQHITESLNAQADGLCRNVKVKTGRFNQHVAPRCVLIECGHNYNTLEQVLRGVPYLAHAIHRYLSP